jgi:putative MATE family efflux protein
VINLSVETAALRDPDAITLPEMRSKIFRMVWPVTIESILQMAVSMVSSALLGHVSSVAVGAVGLGRRVTQLVWGVFAAIGTGTTVMVARSVGAGDRAEAGHYAEQAFFLTLGLVLTFACIAFAFAEPLLVLLYDAAGDLLQAGTLYLRIVVWGVPFMSVMQVTSAIMRGAGNTRVPMLVAMVINIINVGLSYVLIFGKLGLEPMGIAGAAWSQVISQAAGACLALYIMLYRQKDISLDLAGFRFSSFKVRAVLSIGVPTAAEHIFMQLGQILLTSLVVSFGTVALAAHQQGITAESLSYMPAVGFGVAATAFVGQSMGAGSVKLAERYVRELARWSMTLTAFTASLLIFLPRQIFGLLSSDSAVIELGVFYLIATGVAQIPQQLSGVLNGALRGAGDTKAPMVIGALGLWGVRLPLSYFLARAVGWGIKGVWIAMTIDLFVRFSLSLTRFLRGRWKANLAEILHSHTAG